MKEDNVIPFHKPEQSEDLLTELLRSGAQRLIEQAVDAELAESDAGAPARRHAFGRL